MTDLNIEVTYFEKGGPLNTNKALEIARKYANLFEIRDIVIASTTGSTASKALEYFNPKKYNIIIITHSYYFAGLKYQQEFSEDLKKNLKEQGLEVFTATHAMAGIERSMRQSLNQWLPVEILAKYLRTNFSQGIKVCMEIATMAADAGLISDIEKDIICIAGTSRGADTVCLIKAMPTSSFDKLRVKAILAKPL
ncbi:MAG: pyruvate kinase alpha/beta domain-containing protein [Candidatus Odinarchaeota archaeon]